MNLFIDTTNWNLVYLLEKDNKIVDVLIIEKQTKISDIAVCKLKDFLHKNNLTIKMVENFYVTTGPGSYTGVRVGLGIVKTLFTLNPKFNVYTLNSLKFQAGLGKKISILDARGNKSYFGVYNNLKEIEPESVLENSQLENFKQKYDDFTIFENYTSLDYIKNFTQLKNFFEKINNVNELIPLYIKSFL